MQWSRAELAWKYRRFMRRHRKLLRYRGRGIAGVMVAAGAAAAVWLALRASSHA